MGLYRISNRVRWPLQLLASTSATTRRNHSVMMILPLSETCTTRSVSIQILPPSTTQEQPSESQRITISHKRSSFWIDTSNQQVPQQLCKSRYLRKCMGYPSPRKSSNQPLLKIRFKRSLRRGCSWPSSALTNNKLGSSRSNKIRTTMQMINLIRQRHHTRTTVIMAHRRNNNSQSTGLDQLISIKISLTRWCLFHYQKRTKSPKPTLKIIKLGSKFSANKTIYWRISRVWRRWLRLRKTIVSPKMVNSATCIKFGSQNRLRRLVETWLWLRQTCPTWKALVNDWHQMRVRLKLSRLWGGHLRKPRNWHNRDLCARLKPNKENKNGSQPSGNF